MNLLTKFQNKTGALLLAMALALFGTPAFASGGIDVSAVVTAVQGAAAPIAAIGAAVLIVLVGVKVYKWIRRAL